MNTDLTDKPLAVSRLQDPNSEHNNIIPAQIIGLTAQEKADIEQEARKLPWLYLGIFSLIFIEILIWIGDGYMNFNFRSQTVIDPNTGLLPADRWLEVASMALVSLLAVGLTFKFALKTDENRTALAFILIILSVLFVFSIVLVAATGDLPRYLALIKAFSSNAASWAPATKLTGMEGFELIYKVAFYGTYLPFVILPLLSGLLAYYLIEFTKEALALRKKYNNFTQRYAKAERLKKEAESAYWQAESLRRDFRPRMMKVIYEEIAKKLAIIENLNSQLTAHKQFHLDRDGQIFTAALGITPPAGTEGLIGVNFKDPELTHETIKETRQILNGDFAEQVFTSWMNDNKITELR